MKTALILGVNGQDGSYLSEFLISKGYTVIGWYPDDVPVSLNNIKGIQNQLNMERGSLLDQDHLDKLFAKWQPDETYNFAAPSSPSSSWEDIVYKDNVIALGVARILDSIRQFSPQTRFYQASSSEMFGEPLESPQNENTPFRPRNPYGVAKLHAHWITRIFRKQYNLHASSGIMYNHESPRRGDQFVTRKISLNAAKIKLGLEDQLLLGNLDSRRDWGYAPDFVEAMWLMLQESKPDDYVLGTGTTHSVRDFCKLAFGYLDLDFHEYVREDPVLYSPAESVQLVANPHKIKTSLKWEPRRTFQEIVEEMVEHDLSTLEDMLKNNTSN